MTQGPYYNSCISKSKKIVNYNSRCTMRKSFLLLIMSAFSSLTMNAEDVFVYFKTGGLKMYPSECVKKFSTEDGAFKVVLTNDSVIVHPTDEIDSIAHATPVDLPYFTSFKFNNKYNDQVFTDVEATIAEDSIYASVGAIGKWLTPSFQVSDERAVVSVGGKMQISKQSRLSFADDVTYVLGYDNWQKLTYQKVADEVWSEVDTEITFEKVDLSAEQFSTNAPSNYEDTEGLDKMIDGDIRTFFHSTWGNGDYEILPLDECPYIEIALTEPLKTFNFGYTTRYDISNKVPSSLRLQVSHDGLTWVDVRDYTAEDGVPQSGYAMTFESPIVRLDEAYEYLRLTVLKASHKNYLIFSEFWLNKVTNDSYKEPTLISPAKYEFAFLPYGREVNVSIDWLTDAAPIPTVRIYTDEGILPPDKERYLRASITIDGAGVFPDFSDSVNIKGRGNTSWAGQNGKSPYRLKFDSSKKPFGLTKGKSWVLLANRQTGSMLSNAVAMKVASMVETAAANRVIPVELYINDDYRGSYNFTQHVGFSNNSVDIEDETNAVLLELDSYFDEDYKFKTYNYDLPTNVKDPDLVDYENPSEQLQLIQDDFENFTSVLNTGTEDYAHLVDVEKLARFMLVNELVMNLELGHPKSTFLYKENLLSPSSKYVFGPVWDFDWGYGYEKTGTYCVIDPTIDYFSGLVKNEGYAFFNDLRFNSDIVKRQYYKEWTEFMDGQLDELLDYVETYYAYANHSFKNNATRWNDGNNYEMVKNNTISWLRQRAQHIYENLEKYDLDAPTETMMGDVNLDGFITVADMVCIINRILELPNETFSFKQADLDANNAISINDLVHAIDLVMNQPQNSTSVLTRPLANAKIKTAPFMAELESVAYCPVSLNVDSCEYAALQFDVVLPDGVSLQSVDLAATMNRHVAKIAALSQNSYRVVVYSQGGQPISAGEHNLQLALRMDNMLLESQRKVNVSSAVITTAAGEDCRMPSCTSQFDVSTTGVALPENSYAISGGERLVIESLTSQDVRVYSADGRCVKVIRTQPGKTEVELPHGVYLVQGKKVMIGK